MACFLAYVTLALVFFILPLAADRPKPDDPYSDPNIVYYNTQNGNSEFLENVKHALDLLLSNIRPGDNWNATYGYGRDDSTAAYALVECYNTSQAECHRCLSSARRKIQDEAPAAKGARMYVNQTEYSCFLRYENYANIPGYNIPLVKAPAKTKASNHTGLIVGCSVAGVVVIAAAAMFAAFAIRRKLQRGSKIYLRSKSSDVEGNIEGRNIYTFAELQQATNNFSSQNKLGQGGFGAVYKGVLKDGTKVAIKKLSMESPEGKEEFINEVNIISGIQHRNLVKLMGYCVEADNRLLVLEFLENGNLENNLFGGVRVLSWPQRSNIAIGVARGLAYIHDESQVQIIHRDVKASNILLDDKMHPKISDFGISKLFDRDKGYTNTRIAGTLGYLAPEYALRGRLTTKVDVFSYGVLLLEILTGQKCSGPDETLLIERAWKLYLEKGEMMLDRHVPADGGTIFYHVALLCTQEEADGRPTMGEVVAMLLQFLAVPPLPTTAPSYFASMPIGGRQTSLSIITDLQPR